MMPTSLYSFSILVSMLNLTIKVLLFKQCHLYVVMYFVLQVGMPIICMRNMQRTLGIANGTRLMVTHLNRHSIQAYIMSGVDAGKPVVIPRVIYTSNENLPFKLVWR